MPLVEDLAPARWASGKVEATLLPVFVPLAPACQLAERFPEELRRVLDAHGLDPRFVDREISGMGEGSFAKTASRSVVGVMNEFAFLGGVHRDQRGADQSAVPASREPRPGAARVRGSCDRLAQEAAEAEPEVMEEASWRKPLIVQSRPARSSTR